MNYVPYSTATQIRFTIPDTRLHIDVVLRKDGTWYAAGSIARALNLHRNLPWVLKQVSPANTSKAMWKVVTDTAESSMEITVVNRDGIDEIFAAANRKHLKRVLPPVAEFLNSTVFPEISSITEEDIPEIDPKNNILTKDEDEEEE